MSIQPKLLAGLQLCRFPYFSLLSSTRRPTGTYQTQILGYKPVLQLPIHPTDRPGLATGRKRSGLLWQPISFQNIKLAQNTPCGSPRDWNVECPESEVLSTERWRTSTSQWLGSGYMQSSPSLQLSSASSLPSLNQTYQPVSYTSSSSEGSGLVTFQSSVAGCSIQVPGFNL